MVSITIRNLPEGTKESLRIHAAKSGVSLEAYARQILQDASRAPSVRAGNLLDLSNRHFGVGNGIELDLPARGSNRAPVEFQP